MKGIYTISITGKCNRTCSYCIANCPSSNTIPDGEIGAPNHADKNWVINEANNFDGHIALTGGETLLHPDIFEICSNLDSKIPSGSNKKIIIYTNGDLIKAHTELLKLKNVYWFLSTHPQYTSVEDFQEKRDLFPIERTLINHLIFDDIAWEATNAYVGKYKYMCSEDARTPKLIGATPDQIIELLENSKFALPDGFIFDGICEKLFDKYVGSNSNDKAVKQKKALDLYKVPEASMFSVMKNNCGLKCNSVKTNLTLLNFIPH